MGPQSDDYDDEQGYDDSSDEDDSDGDDVDEEDRRIAERPQDDADEDGRNDDDAEDNDPKEDNRASYVAETALPEESLHADIAVHEAIVDPGCSKGMVSEDRYHKFKQLIATDFPDLCVSEKNLRRQCIVSLGVIRKRQQV